MKRRRRKLSLAWTLGISMTALIGLIVGLAITVYFWWLLRTYV